MCASCYAVALSHLDACTWVGRWASPAGRRRCGGSPWRDPGFRGAGGAGWSRTCPRFFVGFLGVVTDVPVLLVDFCTDGG